jgi:hypothetical protein
MKIMVVLLLTFFTLTAGAATGRKKVFECKSVSNKMSTKIKVLPRSSGARLVVSEESFNGSSLWERSVGKVKKSKKESKQYLKYSDRLGKTHLTIDLLETDSQGRNSGKFKYVDGKGAANYRVVKCDLN